MKRSTRLQRPGLLGGSTATTLLDADGPQPSLNLDLASGILDPRITFTRSTIGTFYRGAFNQNLVTQSETFSTWTQFQNVSNNASSEQNPFGTGTSRIIQDDATNAAHRLLANNVTFVAGQTYTQSVYAKAGTGTAIQILFGSTGFGLNEWATFNLSNGTIGSVGTSVSGSDAAIQPIGNGWYRCSLTATCTTGETNVCAAIQLTNSQSTTTRAPAYSGSGQTVFLWGAQTTEGSLLTPYIPTTTAAITQGQIASAAIDVPRFQANPITGASEGLLFETTGTNLCIRSEEFDTWAKVTAGDIVTTNAATAPDGSVTADKIIADTTSGAHGVVRNVTTTGSTTYTQSVFLKAAGWNWVYMTEGNTLTATAWFNLSNGTVGTISGTGTPSATIQNIGNGWYRCTLTFTTNAGQVNANIQVRPTTGDNVFNGYVGNGVDGVFAWGAQMEAQNFVSSYIPTTATSFVRGNDAATISGSAFSNWYNQNQGTFTANFTTTYDNTASLPQFVLAMDSSGSKRLMYFSSNSSNVESFDGATLVSVVGDFTGISVKAASAYSASERAVCVNRSAVATGTVAAGYSTATSLNIGSGAAGFNGVIRGVSYWPTRLPNATLQSLTT